MEDFHESFFLLISPNIGSDPWCIIEMLNEREHAENPHRHTHKQNSDREMIS